MKPKLNIIEGGRDQLEKKLVESLFTGEFDKSMLENLKSKSRLTVVDCESAKLPVSPESLHQSNEDQV